MTRDTNATYPELVPVHLRRQPSRLPLDELEPPPHLAHILRRDRAHEIEGFIRQVVRLPLAGLHVALAKGRSGPQILDSGLSEIF